MEPVGSVDREQVCRTYIDVYFCETGSHRRILSRGDIVLPLCLSLATFLNLFPAQLLNPNFWELESDWPILGQVPTYDPGIGWVVPRETI